MWVLENVKGISVEEIYLFSGKEFVVGRKDCDIQIQKDPSISRKHAVFTVSHSEQNLGNPNSLSSIFVKDSSKYGTKVNDGKTQSSLDVALKHGDVVSFGTHESSVRVKYVPLVVMASCLDNSKKKLVKGLLLKLGGYLVSEWRMECTHLVMEGLSFTVKVIYALVTGIPVVLPKYLQDGILDRITNKTSPLPTEQFFPPLKETTINPDPDLFKPNSARKVLFKGKKFIFLSKKQRKRLEQAIELAGGKIILKESADPDEDILSEDSLVLLLEQHELSTMNQQSQHWIKQVYEKLHSHGLRPIPESEVGLAILYLSLEEYCNSNIDKVPSLTQHVVCQSLAPLSQAPQRPSTPANADHEIESRKRPHPSSDVEGDHVSDTQVTEDVRKKKRKENHADITHVSQTQHSQASFIDKKLLLTVSHVAETQEVQDNKELGDQEMQAKKHRVQDSQLGSFVSHVSETQIDTQTKCLRVSDSQFDETNDDHSSSHVGDRQSKRVRVSNTQIDEADNHTAHVSETQTKHLRVSDSQLDDSKEEDIIHFTRVGETKIKQELSLHVKEKPTSQMQLMKTSNIKKEKNMNRNRNNSYDNKIIPESLPAGGYDDETWSDHNWSERINDAPITGVAVRERMSSPEQKSSDREHVFESDLVRDKKPLAARQSRVVKVLPESEHVPEGEVEEDESFFKGWKTKQKHGGGIEDSVRYKADTTMSQDPWALSHKNASNHARGDDQGVDDIMECGEEFEETLPNKDDIPVPDGFLSSRQADQRPKVELKNDPDEEDIPCDLLVIEQVSLLVRRPGYLQHSRHTVTSNKNAKNFKKFKKQWYAGCDQVLPTIIGGSDLVFNQTFRGDIEEWFHERKQVEAEEDQREKASEDLFRWDPSGTKSRSRRGRR